MARTEPVGDWTSDFDVLDECLCADPFPRWDELRQVCPIAHTDRRGRAWLPTTYADVTSLAKDIDHFSSANTSVIDSVDEPETPILTYGLPPITSDPPLHTWTRRLLLPWFSHTRVEIVRADDESVVRIIDRRPARRQARQTPQPTMPSRSRSGSSARSSASPKSSPTPSPAGSAMRWSSPTTRTRPAWDVRYRLLPLGPDQRAPRRPTATTC